MRLPCYFVFVELTVSRANARIKRLIWILGLPHKKTDTDLMNLSPVLRRAIYFSPLNGESLKLAEAGRRCACWRSGKGKSRQRLLC